MLIYRLSRSIAKTFIFNISSWSTILRCGNEKFVTLILDYSNLPNSIIPKIKDNTCRLVSYFLNQLQSENLYLGDFLIFLFTHFIGINNKTTEMQQKAHTTSILLLINKCYVVLIRLSASGLRHLNDVKWR